MNTTQTKPNDDWMTSLLKKLGNNDEIKGFGIMSIITAFSWIGIFLFPYLVLATKKENIDTDLKRISTYMIHLAINWVILGIVVFFLQFFLQSLAFIAQSYAIVAMISALSAIYYVATIGLFLWINLTHLKGKVFILPKWLEAIMIIKLNLPYLSDTPTEKK